MEFEFEFDADQPPADIADCVYRHGLALARAHYPVDLITQIAAQAVCHYDARDAMVRAAKGSPNRQRAIPLDEIVIDGTPATDLLVTDLARFVTGICLGTTRPVPEESYVRCSSPTERDLQLPYHQDSRIVGTPLVNLWIPLVDCGRDLPGLEIVTQRVDDLIPTIPRGSAGNYYTQHGMEIDADSVVTRFGADSLWHPEFRVGDVIIFQGTTLHRTYIAPGMVDERMSIDLRLLAQALPANARGGGSGRAPAAPR